MPRWVARSARFAMPAATLATLLAVPLVLNAATVPSGTRTLEECIAIALREHPALRVADAGIAAADHRITQAVSGALPQVHSEYSIARQHRSIGAVIQGPLIGPTEEKFHYNFQSAGVTLGQLLFDFGKTLNAWHAALADARAARAEWSITEDTVVLNTKRAYFELIAAKRLRAVAEETEAQTGRHVDEARRRHSAGLAPRFDITRQEVQLANAKLYTLTARNNVALARENLRSAMGLDGDPGFEPHDRTLDYVPVKVDDASALGRALKRRPELLELEARRIAQEERISALQKDYLPMVRGLANYSFTGDDAPSDDGWMIGAVVRMPIFNGGLTPAQIGQARAGLAQIVAEQQRARQDITTEVRAATLEVHRTTDAIGVSRRAVEAAEESLDAAERRYAADVSDVVELTDTQLALSSARANHVRVLADYRNAIAQLERATADKILTGEEFATEKRTKRATSHAAPEKLLPTVEAPAPAERAAAPTAKSATRRPAIATPAAKAESKRPPRIAHAGSKPLASAAKPRGAKGPAAGRGALGAQARGAKQAAAKGARRPRTAPQPKILAKRDR